jgi:hypothetical protein
LIAWVVRHVVAAVIILGLFLGYMMQDQLADVFRQVVATGDVPVELPPLVVVEPVIRTEPVVQHEPEISEQSIEEPVLEVSSALADADATPSTEVQSPPPVAIEVVEQAALIADSETSESVVNATSSEPVSSEFVSVESTPSVSAAVELIATESAVAESAQPVSSDVPAVEAMPPTDEVAELPVSEAPVVDTVVASEAGVETSAPVSIEPAPAEPSIVADAQQTAGQDGTPGDTALAMISDELPALWYQARKAYWFGDMAGSEEAYRQAAMSADAGPDIFGELGNLYMAQQREMEAAEAYFDAAVLLIRQGKHDTANYLLSIIDNLKSARAEELRQLLGQ